jgi:hypothetical protein
MSLILSGTDGLSDVDGSAATPAIRGTDANTGIFFPAADTIAFAEGGVEAMRLDSAGNFGQGVTPSAWGSGFTALQVKNASLWSTGNDASLTANAYYDGTNYRYIGTAGATRQYHNTDGTISWSQAASGTAGNAITFTQAMTLNASGQLILGDTTADGRLKVLETAAGAGVTFYNSANNSAGQIGTTNEAGAANSLEINAYRGSGRIVFKTNNTYAASIDTSGNLLVGTTSTGFSNSWSASLRVASLGDLLINHPNTATSGTAYAQFGYNGAGIGSITQNGTTAVAYNTSSDYRLKENIAPMTGALATVSQLKPVTYSWKADGSDGQGFIAHELQAVVPDCVTGEKDAVDAEGKPVHQGIDTSFLVATLTAAIQEQQALITQLQADVATLKALKA